VLAGIANISIDMWPKTPPLFVFFTLTLAIVVFCGWALRQQSTRRQQYTDHYEQASDLVLMGLLILALLSLMALGYFLLS